MSIHVRRLATVLLVVGAAIQFGSHQLRASTSGVVISQVYGGGGNSGATYKNDFIELFNAGASPVDVTGWSVQYASSAGTSWTNRTILSGVIQPGHYYLVQQAAGAGGTVSLPTPDASGSIAMSATAGKVVLFNTSTFPSSGTVCPSGPTVVDIVGYGAGTTCFEGTGPTASLSNATAALRAGAGLTDANNNPTDFAVGAPTPRNSSCTTAGCLAPTNPAITATPLSGVQGSPLLLTLGVTPGANPTSTGLAVTGNLTAIGGAAAQTFFDNGTNGDVLAGDLVFSFAAPAVAQPGTFQLPMSASDAQARTATATLALTVVPLVSTHDIQGAGTASPLVGQTVTTRGVVTGVKFNGFFIQSADADADAAPNTSEAVFVFTNSNPGPPAAAVVGNAVQVSGTVSEFKNTSSDPDGLSMTELVNPSMTLLSTGNPLPAPVVLTATDLNPAASIFAIEQYEAMRVHIDAVVSVTPTGGSVDEPNARSTSSGLFFGVLPGTGRPFREPGIQTPLPVPADAPPGTMPPTFDGNPERIGVDTFSVFLDPTTARVFPPPVGSTLEVTSNVTVTNITGPVDYAFRSYIIDAEGWNMPTAVTPNVLPASTRARTSDEFTVASMNLERFFDMTDDPATSDAVLTPTAFATRLEKASRAILTILQAPDVIGVEEVENLPTLQALADTVNADAPGAGQAVAHYDAFLMEGNDIGGIDVGFLVRTDKVSVTNVEQYSKNTTYVQPDGTTALLNDRPSLILHARIQNPPFESYPVTVVVNHLRSLSGVDGADGTRIRAKRLAQAVDLANKLQALQAAGDHVISVGDYNAFDVNDGYVDVMGLIKGTEVPASQVTRWAPSPVAPALFDLLDLAPATQRYSFLFDGNAQELDHILASTDLHPNAIGYGRVNADFPESLRADATRPERLSDHDPIVGYFSLPDIDTTAPELTLPGPFSVEGNTFGGALVTYVATATDAVDGNVTPVCAPASDALFRLGQTTVTCTATDAHGNVARGSFVVTVVDTTAPVIRSVTPNPSELWAPNHTMVPVQFAVTVVDAVDPAPACHLIRISGDDGAMSNDWQIAGDLSAHLRAERRGNGSGRTYTIDVQCVDGSGNASATALTTVFVPHDQRK